MVTEELALLDFRRKKLQFSPFFARFFLCSSSVRVRVRVRVRAGLGLVRVNF